MDQNKLKKALGNRIKQLRKERGLTQDQASERCSSVSEKRWSDIERGTYDVGLSTLHKLAQALDVPIAELFRFEEKKAKKVKTDVFKKRISTLEKQVSKMDNQLKTVKKNVRELKSPLD